MHQRYSFSVTSYTGHEGKILAMRNRNRQSKCSREYLDWRYLGQQSARSPLVFWLHDEAGEPVAMAALIFRPYFIDGQEHAFAVLGDISVNEECRGSGVGAQLIGAINDYIDKSRVPCSVVMPNRAAERRVRAANWRTVGFVVPLVCILAPGAKFARYLRIPLLAKLAAAGTRTFSRLLIGLHGTAGVTVSRSSDFDEAFQDFWEQLPKQGICVRDRSLTALRWRYDPRSGCSYTIAKFVWGGELVGYAVYDISPDGMCLLSEFIVRRLELARPCMAAFLHSALQDKTIVTVRIGLLENCDYARQLRPLGFVKREPRTALQIYRPLHSMLNDPHNWFVTAGDKDA